VATTGRERPILLKMSNLVPIDEMKASKQASKQASRQAGRQASKGSPGEDNIHIRKAHNTLEKALLQLDYSEVRDELAGEVGNL